MIYLKKLAKRKDDGTYALLGMMYQCASYFGMDITIYNNPSNIILYFTNFKGERKEVILWRK